MKKMIHGVTFGVFLCIMWCMDNHDEIAQFYRDELVQHARYVLNSDIKGVTLAKEMEMNLKQFYGYKKGSRKIENAYYDTLIKFECAYQKIRNQQIQTQKGSKK